MLRYFRFYNLAAVEGISLKLAETLETSRGHVLFPSCWKVDKMKVLNKSRKDPKNYKDFELIGLLSVLGKLLKKIIKHLLESALSNKFVSNDNQFAYRKSTVVAYSRLFLHIGRGRRRKILKVAFSYNEE